ncbi:copper resistance protein CopC [Bradyrhizobium lablabi]|uniref:copper resistance CopC/CopD family protein n=1 Tax=Bradyrhizobium lablabi TaxID=722472 RepID=UPI001BA80516|nr:copper resistance protein CopC [Bradyrhizobium lablabi]MBR1120672.1 copper resistance protein CopC [Bradyrhizobium lablabi]
MRLAAVIAALLSVLCFATGALAHATLVATEPADGSVLAQAPKMIHLRFNEGVTPGAISLIDAEGKSRDDITSQVSGPSVFIALPDNLPRGTQIVSYRVVSQDGHPVAGSLMFSVGAVTREAAGQASGGPSRVDIWLARIGVYLGLFVGVGGAFFAAWIGRGADGATTIRRVLGVGLVSAVVSLGLQGLDLQNLPPGALATLAPWKAAFSTSFGPSMLIAIAAVVLAWFARRSPSRTTARVLTSVAMAGVGLSLAASGHAATASPQWLSRPLVFVHGVGVAYWIGALVPLAAMARQRSSGLLRALRSFSAGAVAAVGLVALTGLTLAAIQLQSFRALVDTGYGAILLVKLGLVIVLLGFAALNRFVVTPALAADPDDTHPLFGSILVELVLVIAILAAVAGWRFTPPPRALAASTQPPLAIHIHTDAAMFQVLISPGKVGTDNFVLQLMNGDASPLEAKEVTLTLSLPERGVEALERKAAPGRDGYWHVRDVALPLAGRWHIRIDALVTDFQKVTLEDDFDLR